MAELLREMSLMALTTNSRDQLSIRVDCPVHDMNHVVSLAGLERLVYTLQADRIDAEQAAYEMGEKGEDRPDDDPECPLATLVRSNSSEGYLEHVEARIARRVGR